MHLLLLAQGVPAQVVQASTHDAETVALLKMVLIAVGVGIAGIGGLIGWLIRALVPSLKTAWEKIGNELHNIALSSQTLPAVLEAQRLKTTVELGDVVRAEGQTTRLAVATMQGALQGEIAELGEHTERRLSGIERAVVEQQKEMIRMGANPDALPPVPSLPPLIPGRDLDDDRPARAPAPPSRRH